MEYRTKSEIWEDRIARKRFSSLSTAQFCELEGVSVSSFYNWKARLKKGQSKTIGKDGRSQKSVPVQAETESGDHWDNLMASLDKKVPLNRQSVGTEELKPEFSKSEARSHSLSSSLLQKAPEVLPQQRQLEPTSDQSGESTAAVRVQLPNGIVIELGDDPAVTQSVLARLMQYS